MHKDGYSEKESKEIPEIRNTVTGMDNAFDGLINSLGTTEERISEPEDRSIEMSQTEVKKQTPCPPSRNNNNSNNKSHIKQKIQESWDNFKGYNICRILKGGERKKHENYLK